MPTYNEWNVSVEIPPSCNLVDIYNTSENEEGVSTSTGIKWPLPNIGPGKSTRLNFTLNCTKKSKNVFSIKGTRDTRQETTFFNTTSLGCSGSSCNVTENLILTKPEDPRYEELSSEIAVHLLYSWYGQNLTSGQAHFRMPPDDPGELGEESSGVPFVWTNLTFSDANSERWLNHTITEKESGAYVDAYREFILSGGARATYNPNVNIEMDKIKYTWQTGKLFEEKQKLFTKVKKYKYTPLLENSTVSVSGNESRSSGGWGEQFNFSVEVRDRYGRDVTVRLWHGTGEYTFVGSKTCQDCSDWTQLNFSSQYSPENISDYWEF
ncbi:MAG: hypothetical protein ABEJ72_03005, partial [Candidatus Aenigmatarchaeota archaeon]